MKKDASAQHTEHKECVWCRSNINWAEKRSASCEDWISAGEVKPVMVYKKSHEFSGIYAMAQVRKVTSTKWVQTTSQRWDGKRAPPMQMPVCRVEVLSLICIFHFLYSDIYTELLLLFQMVIFEVSFLFLSALSRYTLCSRHMVCVCEDVNVVYNMKFMELVDNGCIQLSFKITDTLLVVLLFFGFLFVYMMMVCCVFFFFLPIAGYYHVQCCCCYCRLYLENSCKWLFFFFILVFYSYANKALTAYCLLLTYRNASPNLSNEITEAYKMWTSPTRHRDRARGEAVNRYEYKCQMCFYF